VSRTSSGPTLAARLALSLAGLLLGLIVLEVGLRIAAPVRSEDLLPFRYHSDDLARIVAGDSYLRFDRELGWSPRPATERAENGAVYRTNEAGLRADREYTLATPPGVRRIAAFGDSFTHCDEVNNPDCWAAVLEREWKGSEVLNFGVPAFGPDQAWLRYQRDGRRYQPCGVLIGYMVENINRTVNRFFPFYQPFAGTVLSKPRFVLDGDGLALLPNPAEAPEMLLDPAWVEKTLGPRDRWYVPGQFVPQPLDVLWTYRVARTAAYHRQALGLEGLDPRFLRAYGTGGGWNGMGDMEGFDDQLGRAYRSDGESFQVASRVLISFARQVQQDGATPVVLVFGRRQEVVAARHGERKLYAPLLEALARVGVPTIDLSDRLAREADRRGMEQLFGSRGHYSPEVNQVVARELARQLPGLLAPTCGAGPR
jgi:hypothetical protein